MSSRLTRRFLILCLLVLLPQPRHTRAQDNTAPSQDRFTHAPFAGDDKAGLDSHEDLNSLSLEGSDLQAAKPLVGAKDEQPGFTREMLEVQWRGNDPIYLYVIKPRGVEKPPAVLYLYGYPTETDRFRNDAYCERVTSGGFAAVGFVSALTGQRYHSIAMKKWFVSELPTALVTSVHDVQMILNYMSSRGDLDMSRIGMFGEGSGGTIAVLAAAVDPRIKAVDLLDPWGDWPDWLAKSPRVPEAERPNYVTPEFLDKAAPYDPIRWLPKLEQRPIRIVDVASDLVNPTICTKRIESAAPPGTAEVVRYKDGDALKAALAGGKLFDWVKDQLRKHSPEGQEAE
jgi:hypothetical protein